MGPREEEQYPVQQGISQEEPPPSSGRQVLIGVVGITFLLGIPAIIDWLGKNVKIK